jgi:hypothetical protein
MGPVFGGPLAISFLEIVFASMLRMEHDIGVDGALTQTLGMEF